MAAGREAPDMEGGETLCFMWKIIMLNEVVIGPVTLVLGNAIEVLSRHEGVFDLVASDPPYLLTSGGSGSTAMSGKFAPERYDNSGKLMEIVGWPDMAGPIFRACRADADAYIMANDKNIFAAHAAFTGAGWKFHNLLNWRKGAPTRNRWYMKDCEYTLYLWKGRARTISQPGSKQSFDCARPKDAWHRTQKPVELFEHYIVNSTRPGEIVLDPFSGSGTTALAAMRTGRRALGIEIDPETFEKSVERLQRAWRDEIDR